MCCEQLHDRQGLTRQPVAKCLPVLLLQVLSYRELYGWSMDQIVAQIGTKNNCTFCGVFR